MSSVIGPFAANNQPGLQPHFVEAVCPDLSEFEQMLLGLSRALNCSSQLGAFAQKEDKNMSDLDSIQFIELERLHTFKDYPFSVRDDDQIYRGKSSFPVSVPRRTR